jgi:hypothetical protein
MPKSRGRKGRKSKEPTVVRMTPRVHEALLEQQRRFREKFGRDPGPNDPVFFDPDKDTPTPIDSDDMEADVLQAMGKAGIPPQFAYAYKKTGLLGLGDMSGWPEDRRKEWEDAIDEYFELQDKAKDRPDPSEWSTAIPELLGSPFNSDDYEQVKECLSAIAEIESRGMRLGARLELAAALVASVCSGAYDSAEEMGAPGEGPQRFAAFERLVMLRAREIYAQGSG